MSNVQYEQSTLDRHASEVTDLAGRTKEAAATAKGINLAGAPYGVIISPIAVPVAMGVMSAYGEVVDALSDAVSGSAEGMTATAKAYADIEKANVELARKIQELLS